MVGQRQPYNSETIQLAYLEARDRFATTENRSKEHVQKTQVLIGLTGGLVSLWANTALRFVFDGSLPWVDKLVALGPLVPLVTAFSLAISGIRLTQHTVISHGFLTDPVTWRLEPVRFRVRMLKGFIDAVESNEAVLQTQQGRYRRGLEWGIYSVLAIFLATIYLVVFR